MALAPSFGLVRIDVTAQIGVGGMGVQRALRESV